MEQDGFYAVAFSTAGMVAAVSHGDYEFAVRTAEYYRRACRYPSARVVTPEQFDEILSKDR